MADVITTTNTQAQWQTGSMANLTATVAGDLELADKTVEGGSGTAYIEGFETGFGAWYNDNSHSGWVRNTGATPSNNTGPSSAQEGSYYVFIETSSAGSNVIEDTDVLRYDSGGFPIVSVEFYRHRYGENQGTLYLEGFTGAEWEEIASWEGDEGNQWIQASLSCAHQSIRFRNVAAGGYYGDIALDSITVAEGVPPTIGTRVSPPVNLATLGVAGRNNKVEWSATENNETINMEIALSSDNGTTWGDWVPVINGESIIELAFKDLTTYQIKTRQTLATSTDGITPQIHSMTLSVYDIVFDEFIIMDRVELVGASFADDIPHRLAGQTLLDGVPVPRRVVVRKRRGGDYVVSTVTGIDGLFEFSRLPAQSLADPYIVTCFDDAETSAGNAMVFDYVYQVDDNGNPPQT